MKEDQNRRAEELFHAAIERPPGDREQFLFRACGDDWELFQHVAALVRHHEATSSFLDESPFAETGSVPVAVPSNEELVTDTGRYRIREVLGEGGMGVVYLADQLHPVRRRVALKVVKLGIDSKRAQARFESERQALALMNHPNIARVFEAGATSDGRLYFAMEYVAGLPITEYCDRARLSVRERLRLFIDVCDAIHHAHQKGVIHRDIKPSNVLVSAEGDAATPKIIDFGVAKATSRRLVEQTVYTQHGVLIGSLEYMSPEQADPRVIDIDTRSDIYSLGVLLYELLTGVHPVRLDPEQSPPYFEVVRRIREDEPPLPSRRVRGLGDLLEQVARSRSADPRSLQRELSGDLDWIAAKALEKDRLRRYPSASEFAEDVKRYLRNDVVLAGPPSRRYLIKKFIRRNRGLVTAVVAVVLTLALGFATSMWLFLENREAMHVAQKQREDILALSDVNRLKTCIADGEALVPPHPEMIPAMEAWLQGPARELAERLPFHRQNLRLLETQGTPMLPGKSNESRGTEGAYRFDDAEKQFQYDILHRLVSDLARFVDPDPNIGLIASVEQRLRFAKSVRRESIEQHERAWKNAVASIADRAQCPMYDGLKITPQIGLVPLGRDPDSGLWEFGHVATGDLPVRDPNGRLIIEENTGVVLVLVPGGCFWMGAMREPHANPDVQSADPWTETKEYPPNRVCLDPFFISKFELTQAQWERVVGSNPSQSRPGVRWENYTQTSLHPVENVTWYGADRAMQLIGLALPTEAQWEYAARAGSSSLWPWGGDQECLATHANIGDQAARKAGKPPVWNFMPWDDGYVETAPVGSFAPNAFGLHDVIGNVFEWCRDHYAPYTRPVAPGDGLRQGGSGERMCRGADWTNPSLGARVARRIEMDPEASDRIGVRPSRPILDAQ